MKIIARHICLSPVFYTLMFFVCQLETFSWKLIGKAGPFALRKLVQKCVEMFKFPADEFFLFSMVIFLACFTTVQIHKRSYEDFFF